MRIQYKTDHEIELQRAAGLVAAEILEAMCVAAKVGTSTWELDQIARQGIAKHAKLVDIEVMEAARAIRKLVDGGNPDKAELDRLTRTYSQLRAITKPSMSGAEIERVIEETARYHRVISAFLGYAKPPYPAVVCTSINEVIVHGIPNKAHVLKDGDIIGIDFGIYKHGFCADTARTIIVGDVFAREDRSWSWPPRRRRSTAGDPTVPGRQSDLGDVGSRLQKLRGITGLLGGPPVCRARDWSPDARGPAGPQLRQARYRETHQNRSCHRRRAHGKRRGP